MPDSFKSGFVLLICMVSLACRSSRDGQNATEHSEGGITKKQGNAMGDVVSPNHCRILATVVFIDTIYQSGSPSDPCSKAPCRANVRVDSILGYGQAFTRPLAVGETLAVSFAFTVAPTKEILPRMTRSYPGVRVGARIVADVQAIQSLSVGQSSSISFYVFGYSVQ